MNGDPYGRGWLIKVKLDATPPSVDKLLDAKAYDELITREMEESTD